MKKASWLIAILFLAPAAALAQQRNAFIDPATGVLKAVGYVEANAPGQIKIPVARDFILKPEEWRWNNKTWTALPPVSETASLELDDLAFAIDNAASSRSIPAEIKDVLLKLKRYLGSK